MKHRLIYLATILVIVFSVGISIATPSHVKAAPSDDTCSVFPNAPGCTGPSPSPGNPSGGGNVSKTCPSSMSGFPSQSGNLNAFPSVGSTFYQCETNWAKHVNGAYVPGTNSSGATSNNGTVDYCHRNFTGDWLSQCTKGFNKNGQGSAGAACNNNEPACLVGFAAGGDSTLNPNLTSNQQGGADDSQPSCEGSDFSLSWIFCPIINGLADAVDGIYSNLVQPLLQTKPLDVTNSSSDPTHTFAIWSNFRTYGNIFLVLALLVVVFGESISGGLIDAYTAKKILPRLLVAAILINISIYIVAFAVDITNIIGNGIANLIEAPFQNAGAFKLHINGSAADIGGLGVGALVGGSIWAGASAAGATAGAALALGPLLEFLFLFFLIPAFLTFLAILVTVLLRQGLILFLVLVSPVAFALYCLPNTEQYFRKWWDLLFKTLLIYPLIAIIFALANVLSVTIDSTTSGITKTFADFVAIIALFVPLFLIPFSFRLAGGVIGRFHEFATNARKQGHEAIKGSANNPNSYRNRVKTKAAAELAEHNISGAGAVAQIPRLGDLRNPRRWNAQRRSRLAAARNMYQSVYGKQGQGYAMFEANSQDSNVTGDLAKYATGAESRAAIESDFASGKIDESTREQRLFSSAAADKIGRSPAMRRAALMNPATIGYELEQGEAGWDQATGIMRDIAGNDEGTYRSMVNEFQYVAKTAAGRNDLSGAVDGKPYSLQQAWGTGQLYQLGSAKPRAMEAFGSAFMNDYQSAVQAPKTPQAEKTLTDVGRFYLEQETLAQNATGATRDAAVKNIENLKAAGIESVLDEQANHTSETKTMRDRNGREQQVPLTMRDLAKVGMRGYDRDPNRLADTNTPEPPPGS